MGPAAIGKHGATDLFAGTFLVFVAMSGLESEPPGCHDWRMTFEEQVATGRTALEAGRWDDARVAFEAALSERESAEALDGMSRALWWLGEARRSVEYAERAYAEFRRAGDAVRASMTAMSLCVTYVANFGNHAAASGWIARAERVLQGADPGSLRGWLWVTRGYATADLDVSLELLERALDFARDSGDRDLELCALADIGEKLVMAGRIMEGLELIDEAMAGTLAGEHTRFDTVVFTCCDMLVACDLAGDLERATQWCRVADRFIREYGCPFLYARCRTLYGSILVAKGRWAEAEQELTSAIRMTEGAGPALHAEALARLADLRLRQGRLEEAEALVAIVGDSAAMALPAASVRLARGEPAIAAMILNRRLNLLEERHMEAAPTLALLVEIHIALGDIDAASEIAARLDVAAQSKDRGLAGALALLASARLVAAKGHFDDAVRQFERALEEFLRLDLPLETARVRFELAGALAQHRSELAVAEAKNALATFDQLGAGRDADAAAGMLRSLGASGRTGAKRAGVLTKREQEVLTLVGLGLSNPEIAQRLFISRKTAAHHVSNLLAKLGLRNRAEAVAYAARTFGHPAP
jgi:ATP/maltotriose-dependent transcriptional regulator MalT